MVVFHVISSWTAYLGAAIILATIILLTFLKDKDIAKTFKRLLQLSHRRRHPAAASSEVEKGLDTGESPKKRPFGGHDNAAFESECVLSHKK